MLKTLSRLCFQGNINNLLLYVSQSLDFDRAIFKKLVKSGWEKISTLARFFSKPSLTGAGIINEVRFGIDSTNFSFVQD